jgi:hypothetical protein
MCIRVRVAFKKACKCGRTSTKVSLGVLAPSRTLIVVQNVGHRDSSLSEKFTVQNCSSRRPLPIQSTIRHHYLLPNTSTKNTPNCLLCRSNQHSSSPLSRYSTPLTRPTHPALDLMNVFKFTWPNSRDSWRSTDKFHKARHWTNMCAPRGRT